MSTLSSIASSGLQAAQLRLDTSAHNVANAQTASFQRHSVVQQARAGNGISASVQAGHPTDTQREADAVESMSATYAFQANLLTLRTADQMLGSLLDERA